MKNVLKVSHADRIIVMDRTFAKFADNTMSPEYAHLQHVRRDYPTYTVVQRQIKKNAKQEHYHGLTYTYYIGRFRLLLLILYYEFRNKSIFASD